MSANKNIIFSFSDRLAIKAKLKCKSFDWFLREVYPELKVPEKTAVHLTLKQNKLCLDTMGNVKAHQSPGMYQCHNTGGNQVMSSRFFSVIHILFRNGFMIQRQKLCDNPQ